MKRLFYFVFLFTACVSVNRSLAQCTPDQNIGGAYLYPSELTPAMAGYYYSQVLTFRVPHDTTITYQSTTIPATIDSAKLLYISNIPQGYSYSCNNTRCTWAGGTLGCALIQGFSDSTGSKVGEYPLRVYVESFVSAAATHFTRIDSSDYTFKVLSYNGLFEISKTEHLKAYPNPVSDKLHIELRDLSSAHNLVQVVDAAGRIVYEKSFGKPSQYLATEMVDMEGLVKGIYTVMLRTDNTVYTNRVVLK